MDLLWGQIVAPKKPAHPGDPADPAYNWGPYDDFVKNAAKNHIQVLFTIYGTPGWANGGNKREPCAQAVSNLRLFASAAAKRYSGSYKLDDGTTLPAVRKWMAWNEPNSPVFLRPQWRSSVRTGSSPRRPHVRRRSAPRSGPASTRRT